MFITTHNISTIELFKQVDILSSVNVALGRLEEGNITYRQLVDGNRHNPSGWGNVFCDKRLLLLLRRSGVASVLATSFVIH